MTTMTRPVYVRKNGNGVSPPVPGAIQIANPVTGTAVSASWQGLGVTRGFSPSPIEQTRWFITGGLKSGKSTLVSSIPYALVLDFERGANCVRTPAAHRVWINDWSKLVQVMDLLATEAKAGTRSFKTVVFDTGDAFLALCRQHLSEELTESKLATGKFSPDSYFDITESGMEGSGWSKVNSEFMRIVTKVYTLGYGWVICGHLKEERIKLSYDTPEIIVPRPALTPGIVGQVSRDAEILATVGRVARTIKEEHTVALKGGRTQKLMSDRTVVEYRLCVGQSAANAVATGCRITFPTATIEIPETGAWTIIEKLYAEACAGAVPTQPAMPAEQGGETPQPVTVTE